MTFVMYASQTLRPIKIRFCLVLYQQPIFQSRGISGDSLLLLVCELVVVALVAAARPAFVILVGHLGEIVSNHLAVLETDGPGHCCSELFESVRDGGICHQAACDVDIVRQGLSAVLVSENLGEAVKQREAKLGVVAVLLVDVGPVSMGTYLFVIGS